MSLTIFHMVAQDEAELPGRGSSSFTQVHPGRKPVASSLETHVYPGKAADWQA